MANRKISQCSKLLAERGLTIAFAESATAGWLCSEFALTDESGKVLQGGLTCYNADLKVSILGVPQELIDQFTPESMEVTREMAYRLKALIPSDIQVTVTGLTTPGGSETEEKPVGTMFAFVLFGEQTFSFRKFFKGGCEAIIQKTITATAEMLIKEIKSGTNNDIAKSKATQRKKAVAKAVE